MDDSRYEGTFEEGSKYIIAPPLRKKADQEVLWKALADEEIQTIATDHCSFSKAQKALGKDDFTKIPGGMSEGRQASPDFNVILYKKRYEDLRNAFGDELKDYYLHYINYGLKENRDAI